MQSQLMQSLHQFLNFTMHHRVTITTLLMFMFLLLFLFSWLIEPRRLINGLIFTAFGLTFLTWAAILIFSQHNVILTSSFSFIDSLYFSTFFRLKKGNSCSFHQKKTAGRTNCLDLFYPLTRFR